MSGCDLLWRVWSSCKKSYLQVIEPLEVKDVVWFGRAGLIFESAICCIVF